MIEEDPALNRNTVDKTCSVDTHGMHKSADIGKTRIFRVRTATHLNMDHPIIDLNEKEASLIFKHPFHVSDRAESRTSLAEQGSFCY